LEILVIEVEVLNYWIVHHLICVGDCQVKNESESRTKCIGTNTIYDSNGTNENSPITLKRADTVSLSDNRL
jgi:hypothetical protein